MNQQAQTDVETVDVRTFVLNPIGFLSDVEHGGTRLILTIDGLALGSVVPMSDFQQLQHNDEQKGENQ